jgi:hypothetical protein
MKDAYKLSLIGFFHPYKSLMLIKERRDELKLLPFLSLLVVAVAARFIYIYFSNFAVVDISPYEANLFIEAGKIVVTIITWAICTFGLTTIFEGQAKLKETIMGCCIAIVPYIVGTLLLTIFSNLISSEEIEIFKSLSTFIYIYIGLLLIIALKVLNDMSLLKTIVLAASSAIAVFVVWGLIIIFISLIAQLAVFFNEIITEMKYIGG